MPFKTTSETLLELVSRIKISRIEISQTKISRIKISRIKKEIVETPVNYDINRNKDTLKDKFFTEEEIGELEDIIETIEGTYFTFDPNASRANKIAKLKIKLGFEGSATTHWVKKAHNLNKENAKKFFFQRLLLNLIEEEKYLNKNVTFQDDLFQDDLNAGTTSQEINLDSPSPSKSKVKVQDLWLYAKFNELKEEEEIPEDYKYRDFVELVRNLNNKGTANTKNISDEIMLVTLSQYESLDLNKDQKKLSWLRTRFEKLDIIEDLSFKGCAQKVFFEFFSEAVKSVIDAGGARNDLDQIIQAAKKIKPKYDQKLAKRATEIQGIFRGYNTRRVLNIKAKEGNASQEILKLQKQLQEALEEAKSNAPKLAEEISKKFTDNLEFTKEEILNKLQKVSDGAKSSDPTRGEWQADDTKNVTYQYLVDNKYVSNGENYYLIPEIRGRGLEAVTQYATGLPVFNYKDLNEFSQDAAEAGKEEWNKNDNRLLSSIACIGEGENKKHCVVTSSVRGVTKTFISQTEFNKITGEANLFYEAGLESVIKTSALDETLEVLNSAKERYNKESQSILSMIKSMSGQIDAIKKPRRKPRGSLPADSNKELNDLRTNRRSCGKEYSCKKNEIKIIDDEIAAIKVRKAYMSDLMTKSEDSEDSREDSRLAYLRLYNNLDIKLPEEIKFSEDEKNKFKTAKSKTVFEDNSYNEALEVVLKMNAAWEIALTLEEAKTEHKNKKEDLIIDQQNKLAVGEDATEIGEKIAAEELAIDKLTQFIEVNFNKEELFDNASFLYQKNWSLTTALEGLDGLDDNCFLSEDEKDKIRKFADKAIIDRSKDKPQEIAEKLTSANVDQIYYAQELANKEFDIKTSNRKEKLEKASDKEKEAARHLASCNYSHKMAKTVERSIENEVINGLDTFEATSMAEDMVNKHASKGTIFYQSEKAKEEYAKAVRKTCKAPVPHTNVNGVGFHRPRGTSIVSVGFSYNGVGREGELTGNTEAYVHIDGSNQCYIGCRVCPKDGMNMSVWIDGKSDAKKEYKRGDTAINQNTISFLDPKTQRYTHVEASPSALIAYLELMKKNGNPYPGSVESIMSQYEKMQIKVTSQVNSATAEEPDIERKVSIMHKGKILSYNADNPKTTIGKKKVVTKAIDIDEDGEIVDLRPGFSINNDSDKVKDGQHQFVKMNIIKLPDGDYITPYVKLSTNADGKVIHESDPYVIKEDENGKSKFEKLTSNDIEQQLRSKSNMDDYDIKDETTKLFDRVKDDCRNTKLILPLGIFGETKGKKYEISAPTDFAGVGRGITGNEPSSFLSRTTKSKAIKLGDVNKLKTVPEVRIGQGVDRQVTFR